jgi:ABC-type spermidine/putrescine transport system permease subunit I
VRTTRIWLLLILPSSLILLGGFLLPMLGLGEESFRLFTPGRVGAVAGAPLTLNNYLELATSSFLDFVVETLRISLIATLIGLLIGFPMAWWIARRLPRAGRAIAIGFLIAMVLLSVLVRTYALELTFGSVGLLRGVLRALDIAPNGRGYIECLVAAGLLHSVLPVTALTLLGTVQNLDHRLTDAAQSLGAPAWRAHLSVTVPLCMPGLLAAFLISFTFSISAFVIPMVLGKGRVLFLSNLIYTRFSEIADYPSGAAISVVMLAIALFFVVVVSNIAARQGRKA